MPNSIDARNLLIPIYERAISEGLAEYNGVPTSSGGGPANPLLISAPPKYDESKLKVMYFGQETNGYENSSFGTESVHHLLAVYDSFANKGGSKKYRGHFWNGIHHFNAAFSEIEPSFAFTSNNLVKVGKCDSKGTPPENVLEWQKNWSHVIREEIRILKPDVIILFTGPRYDRFIERHFGPFDLSQVSHRPTRQLARLKCDGLPPQTYRTYHPNYLWRNGFKHYLREVVGEVKLRQAIDKR